MANIFTTSDATGAAQRKSDRIRYSFPFIISGVDTSGFRFQDRAHTELVTRDGGLIVTSWAISTGATIKMKRDNKEVDARIVAQVGIRDEAYLYGVQFLATPATPFWDVNFPASSTEQNVGRLVLQCSPCARQELVYLSEIELMVFEEMKVIPRRCENCKTETLWSEPTILGDAGLILGTDSFVDPSAMVTPKREGTINDRRFRRTEMKHVKACLHRANQEDDIVTVLDMSRGGIRFVSLVDYAPGMRIEVAVPYTEMGANVFTPGRIARVKSRPMSDLPGEFGLEYIKR